MDNKKNSSTPRVIRTGPKSSKHRKRPVTRAEKATVGTVKTIGKILITIILVIIITCCIVGTALTVYVMSFIDSDSTMDLEAIKMNFNSNIYALNANGENVLIESLRKGDNRVWVDIQDIPQHVQDAFVYSEDERFATHKGVDFKRTAAALVNEVMRKLGLTDKRFGGSTITQQLIKNINGDISQEKRTVDNKIQEIITALNLERHYSKEQILELYLNYVGLHYASGVQAGSQYYFGKDVSELTNAEAAALAITTKSPAALNPKDNPKGNKDRRIDVALDKMLEFHTITQAEYEQACKEDVKITGTMVSVGSETKKVQSYYMDAVIDSVISDLAKEKNYTKDYAEQILYTSGYQIYSNMEIETQKILEKYFEDPKTFETKELGKKEAPQASMVITDLNGNVRALVGGTGEKKEARGYNRATMSPRPAGSTIKPLAIYTPAFENNLITWSTVMPDEPVMMIKDPKTGNERGYPQNYNWQYQGNMTIIDALKVSKNSIPFKLSQTMTPRLSFDYLTKELGMKSLKDPDNVNEASMALGDGGVRLIELTAAFQIFGNGGYFTEPALYSKVLDAEGRTILDTTTHQPKAVMSSDTAYLMNKALWQVVNGGGSGGAAKIKDFETIGKTGTSNDRKDLLFMGITPYYVAGIRYGYDDNKIVIPGKSSFQIPVWQKIMTEIHKGKNPAKFELDNKNVIELPYCAYNGLLASEGCPERRNGYYRTSNIPATCNSSHVIEEPVKAEEEVPTPPVLPAPTPPPVVDENAINGDDGAIIIQE